MKWFRKAADQGNAEAQYELGYCYEYRLGNINEAREWYRKAADNGNEDAKKALKQLDSGNAEKKKNFEQSVDNTLNDNPDSISENMSPEDQFNLGLDYYGKKNYDEAFKWINMSAKRGLAKAQCEIGRYYLNAGAQIESDCGLAERLRPLVVLVLQEKGERAKFYVSKMTDEIAMTLAKIMKTGFVPPNMTQEDFILEVLDSITNKSTSSFSNYANLAVSMWINKQKEKGKKVYALDFIDEFKSYSFGDEAQMYVLYEIVGVSYYYDLENGYKYSGYTKAQQFNIGGKLSEYVSMKNRLSLAIAAASTRDESKAWSYLLDVYLGKELSDLSGEALNKALQEHKDRMVQMVYSKVQSSSTIKIGFYQMIAERAANKSSQLPKGLREEILDQLDADNSNNDLYKKMYEKMYENAIMWYRKAAEQDNAVAMTMLALCYREGVGVKKNETEAARWDRKASEALRKLTEEEAKR